MAKNIQNNKIVNNNQTKKVQNKSMAQAKNKPNMYDKELNNKKNYYLIPIILMIAILPFIVRLKYYNPNMSQFSWFGPYDSQPDYFLYYKQLFLIGTATCMVLIIALKAYFDRKALSSSPIFIPLFIYALLTIGSTIFSRYAAFSYSGSFEQFESIFALLGYCIITYYSYLFIKSERDLKVLIYALVAAAIIMSLLGILQYLGHDFYATEFGLDLILPSQYREGAQLQLNFGESRVYLSLYNPNYVGVYTALIIPILIVIALFFKNIKIKILSIVSILGLLICLAASQSLAGFLSIGIAVSFLFVIGWRYLIKKIYITLPLIAVMVVLLFVLNIQTGRAVESKLLNMFNNTSSTYKTTAMNTNDDNVSFTFNGNQLYVKYIANDDNTATIVPYDDKLEQVEATYDPTTNTIILTEERFQGITIGMGAANGIFNINVEGMQFNFTNQTEDGTYYFINSRGALDKMITAPSAVFTGNELFASNRGYIWSRTIPLLKKYVVLGSGPDTYTLAFPQNDYLELTKAGFADAILTKPHSLYLQIAVQTGVLSLIAFLAFYAMYFVSSLRLYIKGRFNSDYAKIGLAIFIGTISYMVSGITNDSCISTAPIFWALIGIGIAVNYKAKPFIMEETAEYKLMKAERKN